MHASPPRGVAVAGAVLGAAVVTVVGGLLEARAYRVVRHHLTLSAASLPDGLRILHISDLHYVKGQTAKARFVAALAGLAPDLVIATGDLLSDDNAFDEFATFMGPLLKLPGAFVFGSNDYFGPTPVNPAYYLKHRAGHARTKGPLLAWRRVRDALTAAGWMDLNNARARLSAGGLALELRGAGDAHIGMDDYAAGAPPDADWVDQPASLLIGVTHAPYRRVLDAMAADGVTLMLAGHTHGGQICLPGKALVANCDLPTSMIKDVHRYPFSVGQPAWLHVSAGVGSAPTFPLRTFCRPEACMLDINLAS